MEEKRRRKRELMPLAGNTSGTSVTSGDRISDFIANLEIQRRFGALPLFAVIQSRHLSPRSCCPDASKF